MRWILVLVLAATLVRGELALANSLSKETLVNLLSRVAEGALMPGDIAAAVREAAATQRASHSVADDSNASVVRARDLGPNVIGRRLRADEGASIRAVMLFRKPSTSTGQLVVVQDGLNVLRAQTSPFAIVSAVGPTRTGKSSILGRAFFRGADENVFEIGSGVTSFTGGIWITNRPVRMQMANGELSPVPVFLIDTEGFSGVGGLTSRTYEANLFGITYLLSSALIFNSMFPVDASTVAQMNRHCSHALQMLKSLKDASVWTHRHLPKFLWSVQSFNTFNLRNTGISADELLSSLRNSSTASTERTAVSTGAVAALLGSSASRSSASTTFLVEHLFESARLVPVRRPHGNDEIVANLAQHKSSELSADYLADAECVQIGCRTSTGRVPCSRALLAACASSLTPRSSRARAASCEALRCRVCNPRTAAMCLAAQCAALVYTRAARRQAAP